MEPKIPGIVILRNIVSIDEQIKLVDIVKRRGGLKSNDDNWNFLNIRGRHFCSIRKYPQEDSEFLLACCNKFKTETEQLDKTLIWPDVTHLLTLWYPDTKGMGWHVD